jgi:hypothetical protein
VHGIIFTTIPDSGSNKKHSQNRKAMKAQLTSAIILIFILCTSSSSYSQKVRCVTVKGNEVIVPVNPSEDDTCSITRLSKESLLEIERLVCSDTSYKILSFTAVFQFDDIVPSHCKSNIFSHSAREKMAELKPGRRMWAEQIEIKSPDGKTEIIPGFCIKVE